MSKQLDSTKDRYCCEKDGWDFTADSATELLGVVAFFDFHQPTKHQEYWWKIEEPWLLDALPETPKDFNPVWKKHKE